VVSKTCFVLVCSLEPVLLYLIRCPCHGGTRALNRTGGDFLVKVEKRSGGLEVFDVSKLEASLTKAGASEQDATRIAETVARGLTEGTDTAQLMMRAASELKRIDPAAAKKYESFKSARSPS